MKWINSEFWNAWKQSNTSPSKNSRSRYLGSRICLEEKRDEYRRRCSSDENNVDDDNEGGIGVGGAPVAPWCRVPVAAAEVDETLTSWMILPFDVFSEDFNQLKWMRIENDEKWALWEEIWLRNEGDMTIWRLGVRSFKNNGLSKLLIPIRKFNK